MNGVTRGSEDRRSRAGKPRQLQDDARQLNLELSANGAQWGAPVMEGKGAVLFEIIFKAPQKARFIRITQTGSAGNSWGINELALFKK